MPRLSTPDQTIRSTAPEQLAARSVRASDGVSVRYDAAPRFGLITNWMRRRLVGWLMKLDADQVVLLDGPRRIVCGNCQHAELTAALEVTDSRFYWLLLTGGSLGVAEAYLCGYWQSDNLTTLLRIFARHSDSLIRVDHKSLAWLRRPWQMFTNWLNRNSRSGSRRNIAAHYDLSNEFFSLFLDPTMTYSSGLFPQATSSMEEASLAKYDRICRKLDLSSDDHVLEIGTGWGGFAIYAAQRYGCRVTTTTISREQRLLALERVKAAGLENQITILSSDYRDLSSTYDKLVSIEMIEAVGHAYLPNYFEHCCRLLKPNGVFVLQAITIPDQRYRAYCRGVDFIQRYIFPGGCLPSLNAIQTAVAGKTDFQLIHLEDFAAHYARTLANWSQAFEQREVEIRGLGMDDRFIRAWAYYFAYCRAGFEERQVGVSQLVFARSQARIEPFLEPLVSPAPHFGNAMTGE